MKHISRRVFTAPTEKSLQILQLPPPLKWLSNINTSFLYGTVQFFVLTLLFFVSLLISSLWHGIWLGIFRFCCFSAIVYSLDLSLNISDQVRAGTAPAWGRGTVQCVLREGGGLPEVYAQEWLTLLRHSPWHWLVMLIGERLILANQITATGCIHRQWIFTQLTCIIFYCQIIMTILANITKKMLQTTALKRYGVSGCEVLIYSLADERRGGCIHISL